MLKDLNTSQLLLIDIETIPAYPSFDNAPEDEQKLWIRKAALLSPEKSPSEVYKKAGIYAEFGRVICISTGRIVGFATERKLKIRSFSGADEPALLRQFALWLDRNCTSQTRLCAHNGKEFDFPWLSRRMLINGIKLPRILDNSGKKPWEVNHIDTLELWKFGDYKHFTSLALLAHVFGIPSPKNDMDGSMVADTWWVDKDLNRIRNYCEQDVATLAQVVLRLKTEPLISENTLEISS